MDLKVRLGNNGCRLSLFISKPVGARFEQMGSKIQDCGKFSFRNRVYHLQKSVPLSEKRPPFMEGLKLLSKIALKKWNKNFHLEHSERKNRTTYSEILLLPEISNWMKRKTVFHLLSNWIFRNRNSLFVTGKQPTSLSVTWSRSEIGVSVQTPRHTPFSLQSA